MTDISFFRTKLFHILPPSMVTKSYCGLERQHGEQIYSTRPPRSALCTNCLRSAKAKLPAGMQLYKQAIQNT